MERRDSCASSTEDTSRARNFRGGLFDIHRDSNLSEYRALGKGYGGFRHEVQLCRQGPERLFQPLQHGAIFSTASAVYPRLAHEPEQPNQSSRITISQMEDISLFYGTLRSEFGNPAAQNPARGGPFVGSRNSARFHLRVSHYPAYRPTPTARVTGELYSLPDPARTFAELDRYEGEEFTRIRVLAAIGDKEKPAWIYQYNQYPPGVSRIVSGDFCKP